MNLQFANEWAYSYLISIPLILLTAYLLWRRSENISKEVFGKRVIPFLLGSVSKKRRKVKLVLEIMVILLAVVALSRPRVLGGQQEIKSRGIELIVALDVSNSMLAEDVKPNRLNHAKRVVTRLVDQLGGDKVGLIAFAGSAALMAPLTVDHSAIKLFMDSMTTDSVSTQGTQFAKVLQEARSAFQRGGIESDDETHTARVVLIASDGEDHQPGAIGLAKDLVKSGIRIFALGFGTEEGAPIPIKDSTNKVKGYKRGKDGKVIMSRSKGDALKELASVGGGSFYSAGFSGTEVANIVKELEHLEQADFDSLSTASYEEYYQYFLLLAIILGLIEIAVTERRSTPLIWKGRFES